MAKKAAARMTVFSSEERLRLDAAEKLGAMMALSLRLLDDCGMQAALAKGDVVGALNAAARLIKSNADVTHALVRAAQGETRHRSINETRTGTLPGLNPNFSGGARDENRDGVLQRQLAQQINGLLIARGLPPLPDGSESHDSSPESDDAARGPSQ
jgi:hypothetical protein